MNTPDLNARMRAFKNNLLRKRKRKNEVTTTSSVGGAYSTPMMARNTPANRKFFKDPPRLTKTEHGFLQYPKLRRVMEIVNVHPEHNVNAKIFRKFHGTYNVNDNQCILGKYFIYEDTGLPRRYIVAFVTNQRNNKHMKILAMESSLQLASRRAHWQANKNARLQEARKTLTEDIAGKFKTLIYGDQPDLNDSDVFPIWVLIKVYKGVPMISVGLNSNLQSKVGFKSLTKVFNKQFNANPYITNIIDTIKNDPLEHDVEDAINRIDYKIVTNFKKLLKVKRVNYSDKAQPFLAVFSIPDLPTLAAFYNKL